MEFQSGTFSNHFQENFADRLRHQRGYGVPHLFVLFRHTPGKEVSIWKALYSGGFAHGDRSRLLGVEKASPMRVAFRHDGRTERVGVEASVASRMIASPRALKPFGQKLKGNVAPTPSHRNVLEPL